MRAWRSWNRVIAVILLSAQAASASELKVVVLVSPLTPYVAAVMEGVGAPVNLLKPSQEPHDFALSPSQAKALSAANILVVPDMSMNPTFAALAKKYPQLKVIELSQLKGAKPMPYAHENPWLEALKEQEEHGHEDAHDHDHHHEEQAATDPHLWLDPERMAAIATPLAQALAETAPEKKEQLETNARALATHLRTELLPQLRALLKPTAKADKDVVPFITYHAAYQYFLARFGLSHAGEITHLPDAYMGGKSLSHLLKMAEKTRIRCIIGEAETTLVSRIAKASGARVVVLSPEQGVAASETPAHAWLKNDYDRLLYKTVKSFGDCL